MSEVYFQQQHWRGIDPQIGPGLHIGTYHIGEKRTTGMVGANKYKVPVIWEPVGGGESLESAAYGLRAFHRAHRVISLQRNEQTTKDDMLALAVGERLYREESYYQKLGRACVTTSLLRHLPDGYSAVPHLVGLQTRMGVADKVIWELLANEHAYRRFGNQATHDFVHSNLLDLIAFRRTVREGTFAPAPTASPAEHTLSNIIRKGGHHISTPFVYKYASLLKSMFETYEPAAQIDE